MQEKMTNTKDKQRTSNIHRKGLFEGGKLKEKKKKKPHNTNSNK